MRIKSGNITTYVHFEGRSSQDFTTPVAIATSKFRVKRSRNNGANTAWTTPSIALVDTGVAGYTLLVDEDTTLSSGQFSEEMRIRITDTGGNMAPAVRVVELYQNDTGDIADANWAYASRALTAGVNVTQVVGDTGAAIHLRQMVDHVDTGRLLVEATATLDTGAVHDAVWAVPAGNSNRTLTGIDTGAAIHLARLGDEYDTGRIAADATAVLDTGAVHDSVWGVAPGDGTRALTTFQFDTGISDSVWKASPSAYVDTGSAGYAQGRVQKIGTDTGAAHLVNGRLGVEAIAVSDTGLNQRLSVIDTGVSGISVKVAVLDTGLGGVSSVLAIAAADADTGLRSNVAQSIASDTGLHGGVANVQSRLPAALTNGKMNADATAISDTGVNDRLSKIYAEVDTGLRAALAVIAAPTADQNATALLEKTAIDGRKVVEVMRLWTSVLGGTVVGAGTGTERFARTDDTGTPRITSTVDANGNRTSISYALDT